MPTRLGVRRARRISKNPFRLKKTPWIDPYPGIPGTEPEKRLFDAMMRRHIYFIFQGDTPVIRQGDKDLRDANKAAKAEAARRHRSASDIVLWNVGFKPDFVLPEYRVILDPFGVFHHSLPEAIARDVQKSVVYRALGYAFYHPWWSERGWEWVEANSAGIPGKQRLTAARLQKALKIQQGAERRGATSALTPLGTDTFALLDRIPELRHGPRWPLTDPEDIEAKRTKGYRLGKNLGAGATGVAAANRKRKRPPAITLHAAGRRRRNSRRRY